MTPIRFLVIAFLLVLAPLGCSASAVFGPCADDQICVNGAVRYYDFEGGFWAIRGDDSVTYDPIAGLPEDFREAGLRVHLRARARRDVGSHHMAGPVVDILSLHRLP